MFYEVMLFRSTFQLVKFTAGRYIQYYLFANGDSPLYHVIPLTVCAEQ